MLTDKLTDKLDVSNFCLRPIIGLYFPSTRVAPSDRLISTSVRANNVISLNRNSVASSRLWAEG